MVSRMIMTSPNLYSSWAITKTKGSRFSNWLRYTKKCSPEMAIVVKAILVLYERLYTLNPEKEYWW